MELVLKIDRPKPEVPDEEAALAIGVKALEFIAGDGVEFHRFLALSGLDVGEIRAAAADPAFFAGLLDFLLGHEPTLLAFCEAAALAPATVSAARRRLDAAFGTAAP